MAIKPSRETGLLKCCKYKKSVAEFYHLLHGN